VTTQTYATTGVDSIPRPELHVAGKVCLGLLAFLGLGAFGGGTMLILNPDGRAMQWDVSMLSGSPFSDFAIPGLILLGLFGVGSLVVAGPGLLRTRLAPFLAFAIGCGLMIWIVVELAVIKELSFLHPLMFGTGLFISLTSVRWGWPTFRTWRASR
jgi:hypothetical protein